MVHTIKDRACYLHCGKLMKKILTAAALVMALSANAQTTKPIRYTWIVTSCATWNCAAAALILAGGDKYVITLPTGNETHPWLILKRVEEGSISIPDDEPFSCDVYPTVLDATLRYTTMDTCLGAMLLNVPDGSAVVMSLKKCDPATTKRRAVH